MLAGACALPDETFQARVIADTGHGRPAKEAVAGSPTRAPRARRARGMGTPLPSPARRSDRDR